MLGGILEEDKVMVEIWRKEIGVDFRGVGMIAILGERIVVVILGEGEGWWGVGRGLGFWQRFGLVRILIESWEVVVILEEGRDGGDIGEK